MSHTPGPWTLDPDIGVIFTSDGSKAIQTGGAGCAEEYQANARLIASAPELAERVKALEAENAAMRNVVERAKAWKQIEQWPYLSNSDLAHALDAFERTQHDENCDAVDLQIQGKPCNCTRIQGRRPCVECDHDDVNLGWCGIKPGPLRGLHCKECCTIPACWSPA